jgi:uncharacterized protein (TIGR02284 family)
METTTETIEVLNDLVQINNDRITGYENSAAELDAKDWDLKSLFMNMIKESRDIKMSLVNEVQVLGGEVDNGTTNSGKIYRAWLNIKSVFTGHNRHEVLANCEAGEDATQRAYNQALDSDDLPRYIRQMLTAQQGFLKQSHDKIKALRNNNL